MLLLERDFETLSRDAIVERAKAVPRARIHTIRFEGWSEDEILRGLMFIGPLGGWGSVTSLEIGERVSGPAEGTLLERAASRYPRIARYIRNLPPLLFNYQSIAPYWFPNLTRFRLQNDDAPLGFAMRQGLTSLGVDMLPGMAKQISSCGELQELSVRIPLGVDQGALQSFLSGDSVRSSQILRLTIFGLEFAGSIHGLIQALPNLQELEVRADWNLDNLATWSATANALADHPTLRAVNIWFVTVNVGRLALQQGYDQFMALSRRLIQRQILQLKFEIRWEVDDSTRIGYAFYGKRKGFSPSAFRRPMDILYQYGLGRTICMVLDAVRERAAQRFEFTLRELVPVLPDPFEHEPEHLPDEDTIRRTEFSLFLQDQVLYQLRESVYKEVRLHLVSFTQIRLQHVLKNIARMPNLEDVEIIVHSKKSRQQILALCRADIKECLLERRSIRRFRVVSYDGTDVRDLPEIVNDHDASLGLIRSLEAFAACGHKRLGARSPAARLPSEVVARIGYMFDRRSEEF
jgi:hypothetical protein